MLYLNVIEHTFSAKEFEVSDDAKMTVSCVPPKTALSNTARALSIRQPWAWAVLYAGKRVENRTWYTAYRGPLYIHAGLHVDYDAVTDLADAITSIPAPRPTAYCGTIIGTAELVDCVKADVVPADQASWATGPWCFVLASVSPLPRPVHQKGALGFFSIEPRAELTISSFNLQSC